MADTAVDIKQTKILLKFYFQCWYTYSRYECHLIVPPGLPGLPSGTSEKVTNIFSKGCDWLLLH